MYSRRELLASLGAGSAVLLAGCADDSMPVSEDDKATDDTSDSGGPSPVSEDDKATDDTSDSGGPSSRTPGTAFQGKLVGSRTGDWAYFGSAVTLSADGTTALIGSEQFNAEDVPGGGRAFVFERSGVEWTETATLDPVDGQLRFGRAVALSADGRVALVGAPYDDALGYYTGSVSVFERDGDGWRRQAVLFARDAERGEYFGSALSLSADGSTALVGAPGKDLHEGQSKGNGVYLFERDGDEWREVTKVASAAVDPGLFGHEVALSADGTTAFVAASREPQSQGDGAGPVYGVGAVYVYDLIENGGSSELRPSGVLRPTDDVRGFGQCLSPSADGRTLLLGVFRHLDTATGRAAVFVREGDSWSRQATLQPDGDSTSGWFASAVSLSGAGNLAVVRDVGPEPVPGAAPRRDGGDHPPVVHVFRFAGGGWERVATLDTTDPEPVGLDYLYQADTVWLSADGSTVLVGAPALDTFPGAAFVYGLDN